MNVAVFVTPPPLPVTVIVEFPVPVVDATFRVSRLLPLPGEAIDAGENAPVTPRGKPLTDSAMADANPFAPAVAMLRGSDAPRDRMTFVPAGVMVNVGPITVSAMLVVFVNPPPDPVAVSVYDPPIVPAAAVSVKVLLPLPGDAMDVGENFAVTPFGSPLIESAIADLNPPSAVVLTPTLVELPAVTLALVEVAVKVNVGTTRVRLMVWLCVTPPPVPFNVNVAAPAAAVTAAVSVTVLVPFPGDAMLVGEKLAVTPAGKPLAESEIADLNPFTAAVVTVSLLGVPAVTVPLVALGVSVKVGATTVAAIDVLLPSPPPLPLIVIVELLDAAVVAAEIVTVTGADAVSVDEENFTVTPEAAPLALKATDE